MRAPNRKAAPIGRLKMNGKKGNNN